MKKIRNIPRLVAAVVFGAVLIACDTPSDSGKPISQASPAPSGNTVVEPAKDSYATPTPKDFKLTMTITKKQCFDTAGMNLEWKVKLTKVTAIKLDPDKTYDLLYDIKGLDSEYSHSLEIQGDEYSYDSFEYGSSKTCKPKLSAVITSIEEQ